MFPATKIGEEPNGCSRKAGLRQTRLAHIICYVTGVGFEIRLFYANR